MINLKHRPLMYCLLCCWTGICLAQVTDPNVTVEAVENDLLLAELPTTTPQRQLWKARVSASDLNADEATKDQLRELIKKVGSIRFDEIEPSESTPPRQPKSEPAVQPVPQPAVVVEPVNVVEPNEVVQKAAANKTETAKPKVKPERPEGYISDETLAIFQQMLVHPEKLKNPLELADILYRSECYKEAGVCYQVALDRITDADEDPYQNRAWVLFQLGNCLTKDDPLAAMNKFQSVIKEYPGCPWADMARTKVKVIDWELKDKPTVLISECTKPLP